jgi:acetyl esterase/lipase
MKLLALLLASAASVFAQTTTATQDLQHPPVNPEFIALPDTAASVVPIEHKNITYLHASGSDLQLDVYQQPGTKAAPVVVYFHGGAWWKKARSGCAI